MYKWLEAVGWELGREPIAALRARRTRPSRSSPRAQRPDGYLSTYVQVVAPGSRTATCRGATSCTASATSCRPRSPGIGRSATTACSSVASRAVDASSASSGPPAATAIDGHPEIEMALVELYRITGERRYLELAGRFVERARARACSGRAASGRRTGRTTLPCATRRRSPATPCVSCTSMRRGRRRGELGDDELLGAVDATLATT